MRCQPAPVHDARGNCTESVLEGTRQQGWASTASRLVGLREEASALEWQAAYQIEAREVCEGDRESESVSEEAARGVAWDVWVGLHLAPQRSLAAKSSDSTPELTASAQAASHTARGHTYIHTHIYTYIHTHVSNLHLYYTCCTYILLLELLQISFLPSSKDVILHIDGRRW